MRAIALLLLLPGCSALTLRHPTQMLLVTTPDWNAVDGTMQRYEFEPDTDDWRAVGAPFAVVVGKNGLAWGRAEESESTDAPIKREGDGKAPAGGFALPSAFGYAPRDAASFVLLPYRQMTRDSRCVDDPASAHYNEILDQTLIPRVDWHSAEEMLRHDDLYRFGIVVAHNTAPAHPGAGSCIFLHLWSGEHRGTAGCTAMAKEHLDLLLRWLDPARNPVLVQLPLAELVRRASQRRLPEPSDI